MIEMKKMMRGTQVAQKPKINENKFSKASEF